MKYQADQAQQWCSSNTATHACCIALPCVFIPRPTPENELCTHMKKDMKPTTYAQRPAYLKVDLSKRLFCVLTIVVVDKLMPLAPWLQKGSCTRGGSEVFAFGARDQRVPWVCIQVLRIFCCMYM